MASLYRPLLILLPQPEMAYVALRRIYVEILVQWLYLAIWQKIKLMMNSTQNRRQSYSMIQNASVFYASRDLRNTVGVTQWQMITEGRK